MVECRVSKPYERYVSGEYLANNPTWDEEDSAWKAAQVIKMLERNRISPSSMVEVGCGAGGVLAELCKSMPAVKYAGYEIAKDASRFWEKHRALGIDLHVADFLSEETSCYDVLMLLDVIEHVPDPFAFLSALHGRAHYYVLHIPLDLSASSVLREEPLLRVREKVGHIHYFTKNLALSLMQESGFQVLDWFYTGAALALPHKGLGGYLKKVPRWLIYHLHREVGVRLLGGDTLMVLAKTESA